MRTDFVQAGTVKLQYFEHGTGPEQLVLVHGYRSSGRIWRLREASDNVCQYRCATVGARRDRHCPLLSKTD